MKKKTENVVFRAALEPLEAAAIKAKAPAPRGALPRSAMTVTSIILRSSSIS